VIGALDGHAGGGTQGFQPSLRACPGLETEPQTRCIPQPTIGRKGLPSRQNGVCVERGT
jgi:hypothetical protein